MVDLIHTSRERPARGAPGAGPIMVIMFLAIVLSSVTVLAAIPEHESITVYEGPQTCVACHLDEANEMHASVHYQWSGPTPFATNIDGEAGKDVLGFNTYCGSPITSRRIACSGCHAGNGGAPMPDPTTQQLNNIDCLMCHQDDYARKPAGPFEAVSATGHDGLFRTWQLPVEDGDGSFLFEPNETAMGIGILEAARTVHMPTRTTCLRCHAYAAGSDCGKRGDLGTGTIDPPRSADVHMSSAGADLACQECHLAENHNVMGRGLDIRPSEVAELMTCETGGCHTSQPHDSWRLNSHTARVACQTCHIPSFAKTNTTEMTRHWDTPYFAQGLFSGQGGFKPEEGRASNVTPSYAWYDGTSRVYALGQAPEQNAAGQYALGIPNGDGTTRTAKIHPMKEHTSTSAMLDASGELIPHSTMTYFLTGDFAQAVADGQAASGLTGPWTEVTVHTYQTINHGVEDHDNALDCGACHASEEGGPLRMDLQGDLGYQLKGPESQVCFQCHGDEEDKPFREIHNKHVRDEGIDCLWCHDFSRPGGSTLEADFALMPTQGVLPFQTRMSATLANPYTGSSRRISARLEALLADGSYYGSWRAGTTNISAGDSFNVTWIQNIPALATLVGTNTFTLVAVDTTPAPFNEPPHPPAGSVRSSAATLTGLAP